MLRLPTIRDRFAGIAAAAEREQLSYLGFLAELVMAECDDRDRRCAARRVHEAGFSRPKRIEGPVWVDIAINRLSITECLPDGQPFRPPP